MHPVTGGRDDEDIEVAAAEDEGVEGLGDEGDTFGAAVPVNGPYQYKLGDGMRHITQDVEKIEGDHV